MLVLALGREVVDDQSGRIELEEVRARLNLRAPLRDALRHYRVAAYCAVTGSMCTQWVLTSDSADNAVLTDDSCEARAFISLPTHPMHLPHRFEFHA